MEATDRDGHLLIDLPDPHVRADRSAVALRRCLHELVTQTPPVTGAP